ncbi:MAG: molybdenum cofactor guanylyltransferase [Bacteroidales bacterium]|nr:molybdenum cofactor guanylyltransferase [Bacteroidales bacterium]
MSQINKKDITGIILAGGKSSRMGRDKALFDFKGKKLVSYAIEALKPLCGTLMISANQTLEDYRTFGFPVISDEIKEVGPMGGILTCLKHSHTQRNLIISCDTPFVGSELFRHLLSEIENFQIVVPSHETFLIEPLNAYYNTNIIGEMEKSIREGNYKLMDFFKKIRFKSVEINENLPFYNEHLFTNINTLDDMNQAKSINP